MTSIADAKRVARAHGGQATLAAGLRRPGPADRGIEAATRSDAFGDALTVAWRLRSRAQREAEKRTRRVLHLVNLPTATDVRRLSEQVAALRREVRELEERGR